MNRLSTSQARRSFAPLLRVARLVPLACGCLLAASAVADDAGSRETLPDVVRTKHRTFQIPFRPPRPQDADTDSAPTRIVLDVSRDLGVTWQVAGETAPATGSLAYTADTDGE